MKPHVEKRFDTSNYPPNHPSGIPAGLNKKVIGMMKDECGGKQIEEFVGLRSKVYAYKIYEDGEEVKKCKGIKKNVIKKNMKFQDYKDCLFNGEDKRKSMNLIRNRKHELYTENVEKIALSAKDDKRIILGNKIDSLPYDHPLTWKPIENLTKMVENWDYPKFGI